MMNRNNKSQALKQPGRRLIPSLRYRPCCVRFALEVIGRVSTLAGTAVLIVLLSRSAATAQASDAAQSIRPISLQECVQIALTNNRALQIERLNPEIARFTLSGSYGYYDPVLSSTAHAEDSTDPGGFDPADLDREVVYSADSEVVNAGLTGFLPSGLSYTLGGAYAHSDGTRNSLNFESYTLNAAIMVRQPLLKNFWTDQGRTAIRINKKLLKMSELGLTFLIMDTINQAQQAYFELAFATEELKVRQRLLQTKEDTLRSVRRQVEMGTLTALEERLAVSQEATVSASLILASNAVLQAENVLRTVLGQTASEWIAGTLVPVDELRALAEPLDLSSSWQRAFAQRPDLAQLEQNVERTDLDLRFRRNQLFPSLDIVASYGRRGANAIQTIPPLSADASLSTAFEQIEDGDAPTEMVGVIFSLPLGRSRERANYAVGKRLKQQAELLLKQREELILREVSDALHNTKSAFDRVAATGRAREYARSALEAEEQKLRSGRSSLFFVLQLQSDLAAAESAEVRARADYNKALSQLQFAEGSLIDRSQYAVVIE